LYFLSYEFKIVSNASVKQSFNLQSNSDQRCQKNYLSWREMLAYYTGRENMHFAVVNRACATSKTPTKILIIHFFCAIGLMLLY
jgi:hypothetical protein